jgi:8-oxo-dGTP diphosphatase
MNQSIDKVAWIYIKNRKLLAARSKGKTAFYTPGGKREGNETDLEVLKREMKEELSIEIELNTANYIGKFGAQAHGKPEGIMVVLQCYSSDFKGELTPSSEIEEIGWLTSIDIETDRCSPVDWLILTYLREINLID